MRLRLAILPALLLIGWALPAGALAASPLSWSVPRLIDDTSPMPELDAISCPSSSLCVAVDRHGAIIDSTDPTGGAGAWPLAQIKAARRPTPCQAEELCLLGISCPSTSLCVAVGENGRVAVSGDPTGGADAWQISDGDPRHTLLSVSCPSTEHCFAVDNAGNVLSSSDPGGGASAWKHVLLVEHILRSISCTAALVCVTVDLYGDIFSSSEPTGAASAWTHTNVDVPLLTVSCTESAGMLCVSGGPENSLLSTPEPLEGAWSVTALGQEGSVDDVDCVSAEFCVATDANGDTLTSTEPTGGASAWTAHRVDGPEALWGVSCASESLCVAVDVYGNVLGSAEPDTGGWTSEHVDSNGSPDIYGVSCPAASLCLAPDNFEHMLNGDPAGDEAWNSISLKTSMQGVSCSSTSFCLTGNNGEILFSSDPTGGQEAWILTDEYGTPVLPPAPHSGPHFKASCPASNLCLTAESFGEVLLSTDPASPLQEDGWVQANKYGIFPPYEGPNEAENLVDPIYGIACPSTSLCIAVDSHGYVSTSTDPADRQLAWSPVRIDGENAFEGISCPSASLCVAVDDAGNVLSTSEPTGDASAWSVASVDPGNAITGISCPSASLCVAVDDAGNVLSTSEPTGDASTWKLSYVDKPHPLTPLHGFTDVSCASELECVAVDNAGYAAIGTTEPPAGGSVKAVSSETEPPTGAPGEPPSLHGAYFKLKGYKTVRDGRILLTFALSRAGLIDAHATTSIPRAVRRGRRGVGAHRITYGQGKTVAHSVASATVSISPTKSALHALKELRTLRVPVVVVFHPHDGVPIRTSTTVTIRYRLDRPTIGRSHSRCHCRAT